MPSLLTRLRENPYALSITLTVALVFSVLLATGRVFLPLDYLGWSDPFRFYPPWSEQGPFLPNQGLQDSMLVYYPGLSFMHSQLREGVIPLWSPLEGLGLPAAALHGSGYLFPVHWVTYGLLAPVRAWQLEQVMQILVGSLATYGLCARLSRSTQGSAIAATAWTFGGWNAAYFQMPTYSWTLALMPLALLGVERAREHQRWALLQVGGAVGLILLVGHLQVSLPAVAVIAVWSAYRGQGARPRLALAILAGIGLATPHLVPLAELLSHSARPKRSVENILAVLLVPREYLCMLFPSLLGTPADNFYFGSFLAHPVVNGREHCVYAGVLPFCLALVATYRAPQKFCRPLAALAALALVLAGAPPLYRILGTLCPPLFFLTPTRFLPFALFVICVLSALGWASLQERSLSFREGFAILGVLGGFVLGALSFVVPATLFTSGFQTWLMRMAVTNFAVKPPHFEGDFGPVFVNMVLARFSFLSPPLLVSLLAVGLTGALLFRSAGKAPPFRPLMAILALELATYFFTMNVPMPVSADFPALKEFDYLGEGTRMPTGPGESPPPYRVLGAGLSMSPNIPLAYGIANLEAYESALPADYRTVFDALNAGDVIPYQQAVYYESHPLPAGFVDLCGVSKMHNHRASWNKHLDPPTFEAGIQGQDRATPLRAFLLDTWRVQSGELSRSEIVSSDFDPKREVLVEGAPGFASSQEGHFESVVPTRYAAHRVEFSLQTERPTLLVLNDLDYPGWQAEVNGQPVPILQAYGLLRAVELAAGRCEVRMTFRPTGFKATAGLALVALLVLLLSSFTERRR